MKYSWKYSESEYFRKYSNTNTAFFHKVFEYEYEYCEIGIRILSNTNTEYEYPMSAYF